MKDPIAYPDEMLTEHFSLKEMLLSGTAIRRGIDNTPTPEVVENLRLLCRNVLEPLRRRYGRILITSGYRCPALNKAVGGVPHSQHMRGEAADIFIPNIELGEKYVVFLHDHTPYDQLILEPPRGKKRWIHVSYTARRKNRQEMLLKIN